MENQNFKVYADEWIRFKRLSIKQSTYQRYSEVLYLHINPRFGDINIYDIEDSTILEFFEEKKGWLSISRLKTIKYVLKSIISWSGYDKNLLFSHIQLKTNNNKADILSNNDYNKLGYYALSHRDNISCSIVLGLFAGLRIGEICGLKWNDIDCREGLIYINRTCTRLKTNTEVYKTKLVLQEPKTVSSKRIVPIPKFVQEYLINYDHNQEYVINSRNDLCDTRTIQKKFKRVCKSLDIDTHFHCLRHTYATNCIMNEMDVKSLSEILGHSNVSITLNLYVHSSLEFKKQQIQRIAAPKCS